MSKTLRVLFIWLMALALPLQGLAAVAMWHCGGMKSHDARSGEVQAVGAAMGDQHAHCDTVPAMLSASSHGDASMVDTVESHLADSPAHSCSACAACCVGLALPSTISALPGLDVSAGVLPGADAAKLSFIADGLERPPRSHRA